MLEYWNIEGKSGNKQFKLSKTPFLQLRSGQAHPSLHYSNCERSELTCMLMDEDDLTRFNSLKGAFLSGLVFPGLGQVVLKHYKRGAVIILTVLVSLSVIVIEAVQKAFVILRKIESEGGTIDMNTISNAATQVSTSSDSLIFSFALLLISFCWIIGVVDAFRIGKKKDIEQQSTSQVIQSLRDSI